MTKPPTPHGFPEGPRGPSPRPLLHRIDGTLVEGPIIEGTLATPHRVVTRKRSAAVALVAISLGAGVTAYSMVPGGSQSNGSGNGTFLWSGHSSSSGGAVAAASSAARGGFGGAGEAHASGGHS